MGIEINKANERKHRFPCYWLLPIINHTEFRLYGAINVLGNVVANVLCSIFEELSLVKAKYDSIIAEDNADKSQVEENERFVAAV